MNLEQLFEAACTQLTDACTAEGILASTVQTDNYRRVWARDAVVGGIAALTWGQDNAIDAFRASLLTLGLNQGPQGQIPSNVAFESGKVKVSYGGLSGRVDASAWFALGCGLYLKHRPSDETFRTAMQPCVERAFALMDAWEFNNRNLIYVPQGGNWADEYLLQGYTLYDNVLRLGALEITAAIWEREAWAEKASAVRKMLTRNFWLGADREPGNYHPEGLKAAPEAEHWAAAFAPGGYDTRYDLWANALALLFDLGNAAQRQRLIADFTALSADFRGLLPAFYPIIDEKNPEWAPLSKHYAYRFKNYPHHFHNGGIWPVTLGFWGAGLVRHGAVETARQLLQSMAGQMASNSNQFSEYLASDTYEWRGTPHLTFSASGYILLYRAVSDHHIAL